MNWRNLFKSSHTLWLEQECENLKAQRVADLGELTRQHDAEMQRIEIAHLDAIVTATRTIADLKKTHGEQLAYAIKQADKLRDDLDRTRLLLTPALQSVTLKHEQDSSPPPSPDLEIPTGTPWQRFLKAEIARQEVAAKPKHYVKPASVPVEGESNGSNGEGRVETPLGK